MPGYRDLDYDVVVVGAGVTGLYQLHCLRKLGFRVFFLFRSGVPILGQRRIYATGR
mgnify:CR=1 FL=1